MSAPARSLVSFWSGGFAHAIRTAAFLAGCVMAAGPGSADTKATMLRFDALSGWQDDNHAEAFSAFLETCADLKGEAWKGLCRLALSRPMDAAAARTFFEMFFRPVLIEDGDAMLFTGYFEPELSGSLTRTARFRYPIYRLPPDAASRGLSRREIEESNALAGRGLEICWVDDAVELFFLHVQGSGRVRLENGETLRVGYRGANGHEYRSVGQELVRRGIYNAHQVSARVIANWVRRNPVAGPELLRTSPSFVFFRRLTRLAEDKGPLGAMNRSVSPLRSIAVDPRFTPLGAPVWIEKTGTNPMSRLMIAQDTGSAIKGAQRADIFFGSGTAAGRAAGTVRDGGRMVVLLPIPLAFEQAPEGGL